MQDLKLIDPSSPRIPDDWRRKYLARPVEPRDVTELFDRQHSLSREKDLIQAEMIGVKRRLRFATVMIWILTLALIGEGCAIGWLLKFVF